MLSAAARFCPRCGTPRVEAAASTPSAAVFPLPERAAEPPPETRPFTTTIIRGYANAMYRLGMRYEVRRNEGEAVRCYGKASSLGNKPAAARLLDIPVARLTDPPVKPPSAP